MRRNLCKAVTLFFSAALILTTGCATAIKLEVERPPQLNTAGIKRIAVMPFEGEGRYRYQAERAGSLLGAVVNHAVAHVEGHRYSDIAQHATVTATNRVREMNYFTLIDYSVVQQLQNNNESIEGHVDALLVGKIANINWERETEKGSRQKDGKTVNFTTYTTKMDVELSYHLVSAKDGNIIGPVTKRGKAKSSSERNFPDAPQMVKNIVNDQLRHISRDLAPFTAIEKRTFKKDKSVKNEMKRALSLVKAKNYRAALEAYLAIYDKHKSFAAAENASILHESFGDIQAAADLIQRVIDDTGNPNARRVLARLNKILADQATIASDFGDAPAEKPSKTEPADEPSSDEQMSDEEPSSDYEHSADD
ncbi:MAG: tetratricopeptide repeat protein [Chitinispirillia bacterium]|nr:tetratricopeptide repeat protein [Chitinispirillia bacterium]